MLSFEQLLCVYRHRQGLQHQPNVARRLSARRFPVRAFTETKVRRSSLKYVQSA